MSGLTTALWRTLRSLLRAPGFTAVAVLTLALGIGANSAIFSAIDAVLLRSLPYADADRLVMLWTDATRNDMPRTEWTNREDFADWERGMSSISRMAAFTGWGPTVTGGGEAEQLAGALVTHGAAETLGVSPMLGRWFRAEEDVPNGPAVIVVGHEFWQRRLGSGADLDSLSVTLDGVPHAVIGVMPARFQFPLMPDRSVYRPLRDNCAGRGSFCIRAFGRLAPGRTADEAQAEFSTVWSGLAATYPADNAGLDGYIQPLRDALTGPVRTQLLVLGGATLLVLLIACANLANLMLARASARGRELALCSALGARRRRLVGQVVGEGLVLSLLGAVVGLALAFVAVRWLPSAFPSGVLASGPIALDWRVAGFAVVLAMLAALVFSTIPALIATRAAGPASLRSGDRLGAGGPAAHRARAVLVIVNFALALALCVGANLFMKSLARLGDVELGYRTERVLTFVVNLPAASYPDPEKRRAFHAAALERMRAIPGVASAALSSTVPLQGDATDTSFVVEGAPEVDPAKQARAWYSKVSAQYFDTMGITLLRGRAISDADAASDKPVLVINRAFARTHFGASDPVGRRLGTGPVEERTWWEIVGVADDVRFFGVDALAVLVGRSIGGMLYEVSPADPGAFVVVLLVLTGVAALACLAPAWRASRVEPLAALRDE
jgi:predicted permease